MSLFVLLFLLVVSCSCSSQECLSRCFLMRENFTECTTGTVQTSTDVVYITLAATYTSETLISLVLSLLCHQQQLQWSDIDDSLPYCATVSGEHQTTCSECITTTTNCTQVALYVIDKRTNITLSASIVVRTLLQEGSKLALLLAGIPFITATYNKAVHTGYGFLTDVPIVSWVCVGLGLVVSIVVLMKPVWWDRAIKRTKCCNKKRPETNITEDNL